MPVIAHCECGGPAPRQPHSLEIVRSTRTLATNTPRVGYRVLKGAKPTRSESAESSGPLFSQLPPQRDERWFARPDLGRAFSFVPRPSGMPGVVGAAARTAIRVAALFSAWSDGA